MFLRFVGISVILWTAVGALVYQQAPGMLILLFGIGVAIFASGRNRR